MKLLRSFAFVFFSLAAVTQLLAERPFLGPIPVQFASVGKEVILDMRRFFHPAGAKLEVSPNPDVDVSFDNATLQLRVHPRKPGLTDIQLSAKSGKEIHKTILTLAVTPGKPSHRFVFKPASGAAPKTVFVAGVFNGWSTDKTPLTGPNDNGEYTVDVPLEPGKYAYKFVVDGKWLLDPANPESQDDGTGNKNSIAAVSGTKETAAPVIYAETITDKSLKLRSASKTPVTAVSAVFETPLECTPLTAKIDGNAIDVLIPSNKSGFVRVVAAAPNGNASNVVRCAGGQAPATFSWHDGIMYYAFTDRFSNGEKSNDNPVDNPKVEPPANFHGGDLAGIR
ncbi:MAG TPA: hypothetical protein VJ719_04950, partial [Chthoniobacterales bacterium]|nr:hypothetical protein [Chthoniobacterales bacterium]